MKVLDVIIEGQAIIRKLLKIPYYNTTTSKLEYPKGTEIAASGAPTDADYLVVTANAGLSAERAITNSTSITSNTATAGQIEFRRAALTGDVTAAANENATTIAASAVTNAKMANMAANTVKVNNTAGAAAPTDLALTASTFPAMGSTGNIAACTFGTGITFAGTVATPSVYWDGTNLRNSSGVAIDGVYTETSIAALNAVTPTSGLTGIVTDPGGNAAVANTRVFPWSVYADGTNWNLLGGSAILASMATAVKVTRPDTTFAGAYTVSNDGTGKVKIKSAAAGAHGLTNAVAAGASIYISAGTLTGLHTISSIPVDTTGDEIILTTAYSGTPTVTAIAKAATDDIVIWSVTTPPLKVGSILRIPVLLYGGTDSINDKKVRVDYGGTNFRELIATNIGDVSVKAETEIWNIAANSQVGRSPRVNVSDTGASGAPITGTVNSAVAQTTSISARFEIANEVSTILARVEAIW